MFQYLDTLVSFRDTPLSGVSGSAFSFGRHLSIQVPTNGVHGFHSGLILCCSDQTWRGEDFFFSLQVIAHQQGRLRQEVKQGP